MCLPLQLKNVNYYKPYCDRQSNISDDREVWPNYRVFTTDLVTCPEYFCSHRDEFISARKRVYANERLTCERKPHVHKYLPTSLNINAIRQIKYTASRTPARSTIEINLGAGMRCTERASRTPACSAALQRHVHVCLAYSAGVQDAPYATSQKQSVVRMFNVQHGRPGRPPAPPHCNVTCTTFLCIVQASRTPPFCVIHIGCRNTILNQFSSV